MFRMDVQKSVMLHMSLCLGAYTATFTTADSWGTPGGRCSKKLGWARRMTTAEGSASWALRMRALFAGVRVSPQADTVLACSRTAPACWPFAMREARGGNLPTPTCSASLNSLKSRLREERQPAPPKPPPALRAEAAAAWSELRVHDGGNARVGACPCAGSNTRARRPSRRRTESWYARSKAASK